MRHYLRPSLSVLSLLLALLIASLLVIDSESAAASGRVSSVAKQARPSSIGNDARAASTSHPDTVDDAATRVRRNYGRLPLSFEANRGQADARVRFLARNSAYSVYLTADEIALALRDATEQADGERRAERVASRASVVRVKLLGASGQARAYGLEELEGKSNYLMGRDPARWRTNVPNYGKVKYEGVYPGVDVIYYGTQRQLEYDFHVAPGADAGRIALRVEGANGIRIDANGDLVLLTPAGELRQLAPHAYQEIEGARQTIACRYVLRGANGVGFEPGAYDHGRPLVIDPVIVYSTYLGGSGHDEGSSIAVDAQGNAYVTGHAASWNFPVTPGALQTTKRGAVSPPTYDAFVTKLNADGSALVYSTYLGGTSDDFGTSIAVDAAGQAHVAGVTLSVSFPVTSGAYRTARVGAQDVFVTKLNAAGSALVYSTYLGGNDYEYGARLALNGAGDIYVGGRTHSPNFPVTTGAFQRLPQAIAPNRAEGFITKLKPSPGVGLLFSTYLGGSGDDFVEGLAVASALDDSVYVTGRTNSFNFPTTSNAYRRTLASGGSNYDAFITRLNSAGGALIYSTYFGDGGDEYGTAIAVDNSGAAYVAGQTSSPALPTTPDAFQTALAWSIPGTGNNYDAFVAKFATDGAGGLTYSTYFGGDGADKAHAIAVDAQGSAYVAGETKSTNLLISYDALQPYFGGGAFDGFVVKFNQRATARDYASYLGGGDLDQVKGVATDGSSVYLTGNTSSADFDVTALARQQQPGGASDCFVTRVLLSTMVHSVSGRVTNQHGSGMSQAEVIITSPFYRVERTDADGYYTLNGLPHGAEVRLHATRYGFTFYPVEAVLPSLVRDETINFSGPAPLAIRGRILNELGSPVQVPIMLSGTVNANAVTAPDGSYLFTVPAGGNYTVMPIPHPDYTYTPTSRSVSNATADQTFDFTARGRARIFVRVIHHTGVVFPNVQVKLSSPSLPQPLTRTTDSYGSVTFDNLTNGANYTVTPSDTVTKLTFSPAEQVINNIQAPHTISFTALPPVRIEGRVADPNGNPVTGVANLTGTVNAQAQIDQSGTFTFPNLPRGGNYTVTVKKPDSPLYTFAPPSRSVSDMQADQVLTFEALPPLRIVGEVFDENGNAIANASVTLAGAVNATANTDASGAFQFLDLPRGGSYIVTATHELYNFTPPSHELPSMNDHQAVVFSGALRRFDLTGRVADAAGASLSGVTLTRGGNANGETQTSVERSRTNIQLR